MANVTLSNISRRFGEVHAVDNLSLEVRDGEFVVLVGPSGCGKSTTLRMIAGLENIDGGEIRFGDRVVNDLSPRDRNIAMVFQSYALYPHMSVERNLAFGLEQRRVPRERIAEVVQSTARLLGIEQLLQRKPKQLSGGQRQRVAMGRAIVREPDVFLFDEPLSNLDAALRAHMRTEIKKLHGVLATTTVYVTHDQIEAMTMADRIVVMDAGKIVQIGLPTEIYDRPRTRFVATFIGSPRINLLPARIAATDAGLTAVLAGNIRLAFPARLSGAYAAYRDKSVELGLRPEHIAEGRVSTPDGAALDTTIDVVEPVGPDTMVVFSIGGVDVTARCSPHVPRRVGMPATFTVDMGRVHVIDPDTGMIVQP
jgi:multiple sugar transport system ATP-binding protein